MSSKLGTIALGGDREHVFLGEDIAQRREFSEETARDIDAEIRLILRDAFDRARNLLTEKNGYLIDVAEALLDREELLKTDIEEILHLEGEKNDADSST